MDWIVGVRVFGLFQRFGPDSRKSVALVLDGFCLRCALDIHSEVSRRQLIFRDGVQRRSLSRDKLQGRTASPSLSYHLPQAHSYLPYKPVLPQHSTYHRIL